ncbi:MAG: hypothetical protein PHQ11_16455 [Paludibacter sp.]|jgi:hypothetical protein|nr:hypothetical protein [Paludibacter sp.]
MGFFPYETEITNNDIKARFDRPLRSCQGSITNLSLGNDIFIHYFSQEELEGIPSTDGSALSKFYGIYELKGLAFSYFIANILDVVYSKNNPNLMNNRHWFLFPLETGKAPYSIAKIPLIDYDSGD